MDKLLYNAYKESLLRAQEKNIKTIAFSLLSAGIFKANRSLKAVLQIGVKALMENVYEGLEEVYMVGFTGEEKFTLKQIWDEILQLKEGEEMVIAKETEPSRKSKLKLKLPFGKGKRENLVKEIKEKKKDEEMEDTEKSEEKKEAENEEKKEPEKEENLEKPDEQENMKVEKMEVEKEQAPKEEEVAKEKNTN